MGIILPPLFRLQIPGTNVLCGNGADCRGTHTWAFHWRVCDTWLILLYLRWLCSAQQLRTLLSLCGIQTEAGASLWQTLLFDENPAAVLKRKPQNLLVVLKDNKVSRHALKFPKKVESHFIWEQCTAWSSAADVLIRFLDRLADDLAAHNYRGWFKAGSMR